MSTLEAKSPWLGHVVDWANPILVKELRQSLKSKQFVITFMLLVTVAWLVSVFGLLMFSTQIQYGPAGRYFFVGFYLALAAATLLIVPFGTFRSLQAERDFNTFEILSVTTITPQQIVRGKLLSSLVQCFIYYSAITPFMAFASTMQGFDAPRAAYVLVVTILISVMLSMASLMMSTLAKQRASQGLMWVILLGQLVWAVPGAIQLMILVTFETRIPITSSLFWQVNVAALLIMVSYFILFQQIATANLTFESANHSTGIRITAAIQFWLLWLVAFGYCQWNGVLADPDLFLIFAVVSVGHWAAFGMAFTAEMDSLSRRVRRDFPKNKLWRILIAPFLPGGARGYGFLLLQIVSLWLLFAVGMSFFARSGWVGSGLWDKTGTAFGGQDRRLAVVTALCLQLVIFGGINTSLARWGQAVSELVKPAHARVVTFLLLMAAIVGPRLLDVSEVIDIRRGGYHFLQVLDPFSTAMYLDRRSNDLAQQVIVVLFVLAVFTVLINIIAMYQGLVQVLNSRVRSRKPADIKPYMEMA